MSTIALTDRDMEVLRFLERHRTALVAHLAERFFATNPFTGARNRNPLAACERRLTTLRAHGYLTVDRVRVGDHFESCAGIAFKADAPLGSAASRRAVPRRARVHHLKTLEAVGLVERAVRAAGGRVVAFTLEPQLRADAQRGTKTRRGHDFAPFPDAVCTVVVPRGSGEDRYDVAVEYATSKYTSADIREKHASFGGLYKRAYWFADRARTSERIRAITGGPCSILS